KARTDIVLSVFPFEEKFYQDHASSYPNLRAVCVGHPLADSIPMQSDSAAARTALAIPLTSPVVALLPGSRAGEVERMGRLFFDVARWCIAQKKALLFVVPAANRARKMQLQTMLANYPELAVQLVDGKSQLCMAASDVVLMASGTTTLEAMLLKKPMVVAYKMAKLSYAIISRLLKVPYVSLPNLLANKKLVPEFLQETATVENLGQALLNVFNNPAQVQEMQQQFITIHKDIQRDASRCAARAIVALQDW
ncbi:MAG TPA: lipid-A-disaccharide synthase, partial [Pseudomonadales bacterium]|nr:lipid-A-disaccharide synthase [Pseudomonadales bacterium]